jgi:acylphosphatase
VAGGFPVWGWVRNQPDGTVELVAEGERTVLDAYRGALLREFPGHVRDVAILPVSGDVEMPSGLVVRA